MDLDDVLESSLFSVSIKVSGVHHYHLDQKKGEAIENFKLRLQKYIDDNNLPIEILCG